MPRPEVCRRACACSWTRFVKEGSHLYNQQFRYERSQPEVCGDRRIPVSRGMLLRRPCLRSIEEVPAPTSGESGQPNLAVGPKGDIYLSWIEVSDAGDEESEVCVRTAPGMVRAANHCQNDTQLFVNWADFPSILELPDGSLAAHWLSTLPDRGGYNVSVAISRDKGETWSAPVTPHRDGTADGTWLCVSCSGSDGVAVIWLDSRKLENGLRRCLADVDERQPGRQAGDRVGDR